MSGTKGNDYTHAQVALYRNGTSGLAGRMLLFSTLCAVKPNKADLPCMLTRASFLNSSYSDSDSIIYLDATDKLATCIV